MKIGNRIFDTEHHCYIMGILNVTPDSFSDGGKYDQVDKALFRVEEMIKEGADIIDVGGESTRPGYTRISDAEEIERVTEVIEKIKGRFNISVSLDTYKPAVAQFGIEAGADMINDIWGLMYAREMSEIIAESGVACCLMHNRFEPLYTSLLEEIAQDLMKSVSIAKQAGIADDKIILDPGIGFGKTYEQNLEVIGKMEKLTRLGYPLLMGASRKSVIGNTLLLPTEERLEGTLALSAIGVIKGCSFIRVHDIIQNIRAVKMAEAVKAAVMN